MRILLSAFQSLKAHPIPAYAHWRTYFVSALSEAGHDVLEVPGVDWAEGYACPDGSSLAAWRARSWGMVAEYVQVTRRAKPIDLFLSYFYPRQIDTAAIAELQRAGIPCVNFFCDNVREFRRVPEEYRPFALHWVPETEGVRLYERAGMPHLHAPMPCWIPPHLRTPPAVESEPPTFIGTADVLRRDLFARAWECGAEFVVRGRGWSPGPDDAPLARRTAYELIRNQLGTVRNGGAGALLRKVENRLRPLRAPPAPVAKIRPAPVGDGAYFAITRQAAVTLGVNRVTIATAADRRPLAYSRLRDIEAPMLGACYLTEWTPDIDRLYAVGDEIEVYRTPEEMCAKLGQLMASPGRRLSLRRRAQARALAEHSVARSMARISARLGLARIA